MMNNDTILRNHLLNLLKGGMAYMPFDEVVANFPESSINKLFPNGNYSSWHLLEHIRLTQADILDFMVNSKYIEPDWPKDYWPKSSEKAAKADWNNTISMFKKDLQKLQKMVKDPKINLYAKVPRGTGQTFLREFLLVADHNSYHLGEFAIMRQINSTWPKKHQE